MTKFATQTGTIVAALALQALAVTAFTYSASPTVSQNSVNVEALFASVVAEPETKKESEEEIVSGGDSKTATINDIAAVKASDADDVSSRYSTIQPGRYSNKDESIAVPFLKRPPALDGSHAGDYGFDPLGFTEEYDLYTMQEAEIRHARLAMLAVIGWPISELLAPDWMLQNGCAPSVLNGFNPISFIGFAAIFGAIGFLEYKTCFRQVSNTPSGRMHNKDMADVWKWGVAGDYGFDPLNLYNSIGDDAYSRKGLREVEVSHGRSAMLAITYFAMWEALTGHPIVENSMFFHPNIFLPILAAGYFAFNSVYELEESDTFVRFQLNSEGAAKLENLKLSFKGSDDSATLPDTEGIMNSISNLKDMVQDFDAEGFMKKVEKKIEEVTK